MILDVIAIFQKNSKVVYCYTVPPKSSCSTYVCTAYLPSVYSHLLEQHSLSHETVNY